MMSSTSLTNVAIILWQPTIEHYVVALWKLFSINPRYQRHIFLGMPLLWIQPNPLDKVVL
jgi:hypothetical protein